MPKVFISILILLLPVGALAVKLVDDPPIAAPQPGRITGRITPAGTIRTMQAVSRETGERYSPAGFDPNTGDFTFADLPGEAVYDVCLTTTDGRDIEGIDLSFVDDRLERLASARRAVLGVKPQPHPMFTHKDAQAILEFVAGWEDFLDTRRVLYLQGHGDKATVLVELMRLQPFYHSKQPGQAEGDIVWRIELWYFAKHGPGWQRLANVERVLRRLRAPESKWRKVSVEYNPRLSVRIDAEGNSPPVRFEIPGKPAPSRGRPANSPPKLATPPHISGIDAEE